MFERNEYGLPSHLSERIRMVNAAPLRRNAEDFPVPPLSKWMQKLAQRSLLIHGELHNTVRMTWGWGKAILNWTRHPADALRLMIDLNHRFALDGSDPNSYGGLLWCLGLFDRRFEPEKPISGVLRPRPTRDRRLRRLVPDVTH